MWNCKTLRHQQRNMVSFVLKYFNKLIWVMSIKSFTIKDRTNQLYICDHSHVPNSTGSKLILLGFFRSIQQDDKITAYQFGIQLLPYDRHFLIAIETKRKNYTYGFGLLFFFFFFSLFLLYVSFCCFCWLIICIWCGRG